MPRRFTRDRLAGADQVSTDPATQPAMRCLALAVLCADVALMPEVVPDMQQLVRTPVPWFM